MLYQVAYHRDRLVVILKKVKNASGFHERRRFRVCHIDIKAREDLGRAVVFGEPRQEKMPR